MSYVRSENDKVVWYHTLPDSWKNISNLRAMSDTELLGFGFYPVTTVRPDFDSRTHEESGPDVVFGETDATATWTVVAKGLATAKERQINILKDQSQHLILYKYPLWKQINRTLDGAMTAQEIIDMDAYINACRTVCNDAEVSINAAATVDDIPVIVDALVWPT